MFSFQLNESEERNVLGIMSGTSCDGLDFALIRVSMKKNVPQFSIQTTQFIPFPKNIKNKLELIVRTQKVPLNILTHTLYELSALTVKGIKKIKKKFTIDLIGVHGHTLFHDGEHKETFQLVSSQLISKQTSIPTVSDFRSGDTALLGEGAPLVSLFDYLCWNDPDKNQLILNIGGISNGTYIHKKVREKGVISFDFGPGNTFVDHVSQTLFSVPYDKNGEIAFKGKVNSELVYHWIKNEPYFSKNFPKTTGREYFTSAYCDRLITDCKQKSLSNEDTLATISAFTVRSIIYQLNLFEMNVDELMITGGGAYNVFFNSIFVDSGFQIKQVSDELKSYKEAIIFALMAYYFVIERPSNLPSATGAKRKTVLGSFSWG